MEGPQKLKTFAFLTNLQNSVISFLAKVIISCYGANAL